MNNLRFTFTIVLGVLFVIAVFGIELHYMRLENVPFITRLLLFVLLNLNMVALLTLIFFVGKSLVRIWFERRQKTPGHRFKTKFVVVLVVMTLIPSVFLFVISSGVVTSYLDRIFDPKVKQPLDLALDIAKSAYDMQRKQTLMYAEQAEAGGDVPKGVKIYSLESIPENPTETIKTGFDGKEDVEVISGKSGDIVRAVVPRKKSSGVLVAETTVDSMITRNADAIRNAYGNYIALEEWKTPIRTNYLLILSFSTLLMVFMALWIALRISRGITDPIQMLARATFDVAGGNLDVNVDISRDDEIGLLVTSFNNMVKELKENKESLQQAYKESERHRQIISKILESVNAGVICLDESGHILTINNAACRILGINSDEVVNRNYAVLLSMIGSAELKDLVRGIIIKDFQGMQKEMKLNIGGKKTLLRLFITSLKDGDRFIGNLVVFDDLTEITRAQRALAWQEVARRIAHEIKNPLTPIKLSTDLMVKKWANKDDDFGKVFERSTKTIVREVESLKRLVDEFSRFGKMPEVKKAPEMMLQVIEGVVNLYRGYKGIQINVSSEGEEVPVEIDAEQFKRVLINIVDNALQAMQNHGRLDIMLRHDTASNRVYVDIADNGPGIPEEDKEKLFMPYFSTKKDGTGLGLAIASRVVAEHQGYIRVRDNSPRGTLFSIELPIKEG